MSTVHEHVRAPAGVRPPLTAAGGEPVSVVHVTAEYFPYARTGGLAEAVSGRLLTLPLFPAMTIADVQRVVAALDKAAD